MKEIEKAAKTFLKKFSSKNDAMEAIAEIIKNTELIDSVVIPTAEFNKAVISYNKQYWEAIQDELNENNSLRHSA